MRAAKASPERVTTGTPAHSASLAVVPALKGRVSRNTSASARRARCSG